MDKKSYLKYEHFMLMQMKDSAHDCQHIYRVLYLALEIAKSESNVDMEILIIACLLHDIGRKKQFENPSLCHASEGGKMAYEYLIQQNWNTNRALHVRKCIESHRYRTDNLPDSIEARILFDADKLDATGAMGIARTLQYTGQVNRPLYSINDNGFVTDGTDNPAQSFFQEYNYKLIKLYDNFFTKRGLEISAQRREAAVNFYDSLLDEVKSTHEKGKENLNAVFLNS